MHLDAFNYHLCAVTTGGSIRCWFSNAESSIYALTPPEGAFEQVSVGDEHVCGLTAAGSVHCSGEFDEGVSVIDGPDSGIVSIDSGSRFSCALDESGRIACWGLDTWGGLQPP